MAGEQRTIRLGDVCDKIGSGATPRGGGDVYIPQGISLIRSQNIYNYEFHRDGLAYITEDHAKELSNVEILPKDVLLNITGDSVARCCMVAEDVLPARVNQHVAIIRPVHSKLNPQYLMYSLVNPSMQQYLLALAGAGATRNALTKGMIEDLEIPFHPIPIQGRIAEILGSLDRKIELNRKTNETLEAMARTLFKSWFIDFDPVRAKAEGRDTGLPKEIADIFSVEFENSELGEIPKGWRINTVDEEFNLIMGQSPPGNTYNEAGKGLPFYQGRTDFGFRFPVNRIFCTAPKRFAETGDTLVSVRAPVGDVNVASERCCIGRGVAATRHKTGSSSYTYYFMKSIKKIFDRFEAEGTVFGSINKTDFHNIKHITPTPKLVELFEQIVSPTDKKIMNNEKESQSLSIQRDKLLPKLLSSELEVMI